MGNRGMLQTDAPLGVYQGTHPTVFCQSLPPSHNQVEPPPLNIFQNPTITSLLYPSI